MGVKLLSCGPTANESEQKGFEYLKARLQSEAHNSNWLLLTNLAFSVTHQLQSDEIDLVVIGPPGVRVIEIKHWTAQWFDANPAEVEIQVERVTNKARKIGTTLRKLIPELPHVAGAILLTQEASKIKRLVGQQVRGVSFFALNGWKAAVDFNAPQALSPSQVERLALALHPRSAVALDSSLRRLAGYVNLELQTPKDQTFHRVYKGSHPARRDRVVLHLYDLSASDDKKAEEKAEREFKALHRLQIYPWAPRILDSYQAAPGYAGEMFFFTVVDPAAPSLEERATDNTWATSNRLSFAKAVVQALLKLHEGIGGEPIIHRNLTPRTILVKHDNSPIITGFELSKIPSDTSVASSSVPTGSAPTTIAPEVQAHGLAMANQSSDLYSLCASLSCLFQGQDDNLSRRALEVLARGQAAIPDQRGTLQNLEVVLAGLLGESAPPPILPPAKFWTEEQVIRFRDRDYRIVSRLGSGGIGTTFKVVETDRTTKEDIGTYVAKVVHGETNGRQVLKAYSIVRSHLRHTALSSIFEVAREWHENEFVALMTWISGAPLAEFVEVFPLLAEEQQETSPEALALRWLRVVCEALDVLHRNGLVHGDVSPRNLIVSGNDLVLTDYDFVQKIATPKSAPGTLMYCAPLEAERRLATPSDDLYALAASFFHVIFGKEPFLYTGGQDKKRGLNWDGLSRTDFPTLAVFLDKATQPNPDMRFANVVEALATLKLPTATTLSAAPASPPETPPPPPPPILREQRVEWLRSLLQSYPGSRWGNRETRGLDTAFAAQTYVETALEANLIHDIRARHTRLVVLCGNAGDGKTALLQHLADQFGLGQHRSVERILEGTLPDGLLVRMNLDGSAAWRGRSADELLDEFLAPFQKGLPEQDLVHLLAINDGRLLEWLEGYESRSGNQPTPLTEALDKLLQQAASAQEAHIRFINLNQRSLVGGITPESPTLNTAFLERLIEQLYGGDQAAEVWAACQSCSAQGRCEVFQAAQLFGPSRLPHALGPDVRAYARQRLFEALQAVHLRGETHITMRELRSALVYILFGVRFCDDYHAATEADKLPYWDRAFWAGSEARQGEVLGELARFDPALEAHPQTDRYLLSSATEDNAHAPPHYPQLKLESARRRAFFEWLPAGAGQAPGTPQAPDLARGQHLRRFRQLPLADASELATVCELLRITPRTPTETAFWVEKPLSAFQLAVDLPPATVGVERLHRQISLIYRYHSGQTERLRLGAELFYLLLELAAGYQLGDVSTDDTFAHLSIFVQRLVREDEREMMAWNPMQDETIYQVSATFHQTDNGPQQRLSIQPLTTGD